MENINNTASAANGLAAPVSPSIAALINSAVVAAAPPALLQKAISGEPAALMTLGRAIAQQEGYLVQHALAKLLSAATDRVSLPSLRIPILDAALDLVALNRTGTYTEITLDSAAKSRRSYTADIVLVDKLKRHAWIIDVKRSLTGYDSKLSELLSRMQAAGLVLPDLLWREHQRLAVGSVAVAVIDASSERHKPENGIWAISEIDSLFELVGFAKQCVRVVLEYRDIIQKSWQMQLDQRASRTDGANGSAQRLMHDDQMNDSRADADSSQSAGRRSAPIKVGLARPQPFSMLVR